MYLFKVYDIVAIWGAIISSLGSDVYSSQPGVKCACPPDWQFWQNSCYRLTTTIAHWDGAKSACQNMGGDLAAPRSLQENEFIMNMARASSYTNLWVGCTDRDTEGTWVCEGQKQCAPFFNFANGQPDNSGTVQHCAVMPHNGKDEWDDAGCTYRQRGAVCVRRDVCPHARQYCFTAGPNGRIRNSTCLLDHVTKQFPTETITACGSACVKEPGCRSINIRKTDKGKKICELNNAIKSDDEDNFQDVVYFCMYSEVCSTG